MIKHTFYINRNERIDRKVHVEAQLRSIGIAEFTRFSAIEIANTRAACSFSHLKCLQIAEENEWENVFIVEDDIEFFPIQNSCDLPNSLFFYFRFPFL